MANTKQALEADDRVFVVTRVVSAVIIPFLLLAFLILYFFPDQSGERFAWAIKPHMMAAFIGAGYLGGAYFFARVLFERRWHRVTTGFLPVTTFTWSMLVLTILHWSRFDFGRLPAQLWLGLYVVTPLLVPWIWWHNRPVDPHTLEPGDVAVPPAIRTLTAAIGGLFLLATLTFYVFPAAGIAIWPWTLTALSARAVGGWLALFGVGALVVARDPRWSAWRIEIESMVLWQALILVAAAFNPGDFTSLLNWYLVATAAGIVGFVAIYTSMERRRRSVQALH